MKIVAGNTTYSIHFGLMQFPRLSKGPLCANILLKHHGYAQHYHHYYLVLEWSVTIHSDLNGFLMICSNLVSLFHVLKWRGLRNQLKIVANQRMGNSDINCASKSIHTVYGGQCWSQYQSSRWIRDISCNRDSSDINSLFRKFC